MDLRRYLYISTTITIFTFCILLFSKVFSSIGFENDGKVYPVELHSVRHDGYGRELAQNRVSNETAVMSATSKNLRFNQMNQVYLTFDDGPTKYTNDILDILKKHDVQATFFLLDANIKKFPKTVKRIIAEGHSVGCHGVTHRIDMFFMSPETALNEIKTCNDSIIASTGFSSKLYRVPFGSYPYMKQPYRDALADEGYIMWDWNIDSYDWKTNSSQLVVKNIKEQIIPFENGTISPVLLMHDKLVTSKALDSIILLLKEKDFQLVRILETSQPVQFKMVNQ
ncbi:polysaccharide deacetylase family protein [Fredinandcohnia humi]